MHLAAANPFGPFGIAAPVLEPGYFENNMRISLSSTEAVPLTDKSLGTYIYLTGMGYGSGSSVTYGRPSVITLWDGSRWVAKRTRNVISANFAGRTASKNYDIFASLGGGPDGVGLEIGPAWSTDSARVAALEIWDGHYIWPGQPGRLYVGTVYFKAGETFSDTLTERHVWNYFNRLPRRVYVKDTTSHTYDVETWRQYRATTTNQIDTTTGIDGLGFIDLRYYSQGSSTNIRHYDLAIGVGSTTTPDTGCFGDSTGRAHMDLAVANVTMHMNTQLVSFPGDGRKYYVMLQMGSAGGTISWTDATMHGLFFC